LIRASISSFDNPKLSKSKSSEKRSISLNNLSDVQRKQTQARDIYDVVWLYGRGARIDQEFAKSNKLDKLVEDAIKKMESEGISQTLKRRLEPFLFNQENLAKLDLFPQVLKSLS